MAVVVWVGGMAFAHFALRPALAETLEPPQRLKLLSAILQRFLAAVTSAVVVIVLSGGYLMAQMGGFAAPVSVHAMLGLGVVMVVIFAYLRMSTYPVMRAAVDAGRWPEAGAAAATVRRLVAVNLVLGAIVIAIAVLGR
jgi:uncharacterized membrane protein